MKYSKLGHTGLFVSKLSFGAMTFGDDPSIQLMVMPVVNLKKCWEK